jgi:hypothetical protein
MSSEAGLARSLIYRTGVQKLAVTLIVLGTLLFPAGAYAQLHWDTAVQAGAMKRFLSSRDSGVPDAGLGPVFQLEGHIAIFPLLRAGAYVTHDISPVDGISARQISSVGLHLRLGSPWPRDPWRTWAFAGLGYAGTYAPSYHTSLRLSSDPTQPATDASVQGAGGGFFEVPLGVGVAYRLRKPWELMAELGTRLGFGFSGSVYTSGAVAFPSGNASQQIVPSGNDSFAILLTVGIGLEL